MTKNDLHTLAKAYLDAFEARNLSRCLDFYDENALLIFHTGRYEGKQAIENWYKARFAANLRLIRLDEISIDGDTVTMEVTATSDKLQAWKIPCLDGRITLYLQGNKIKEARFGLR